MPDREKVITHLDDMRLLADIKIHPIVSPENWNVYSDLCDLIDVVREDAITLLKEQEAVEPRRVDGKQNHFIKCGNCNYDLMTGFQFCPHCGRAVKWSDNRRMEK